MTPDDSNQPVLLHVCCAPCCCAILEDLHASARPVTAFFYNPNIHPQEEYERRKIEVVRFCQKTGVPFVDADYDHDRWRTATAGMENLPERSARCDICFDLRLSTAAACAVRREFQVFATSLGISRWKDLAQVNAAGHRAAALHPGLVFWDCNWRRDGRQERMTALVRGENFYRQKYCGCEYSLAHLSFQ
ncbi:MAG: epoxyqueuosine reductase QueH [Verrucomicrobiae bacterium]|nr:epoxyqueuosine reductase QueH [Verrucomicrobiae bacterium]